MDLRKVKKLIELLEESGLSEIEITEGDDRVRITKGGKQISQSKKIAIHTIQGNNFLQIAKALRLLKSLPSDRFVNALQTESLKSLPLKQ